METENKKLYLNYVIPFEAVHPGEILQSELEARGIKQKDFAKQIDMQASHLNEFLKGKRNMNEELAMKLEEHLGISYDNWMSFHNSYLYDCKAIKIREAKKQSAIQFEIECSKSFNLNCLFKKLNMSDMTNSERVEKLKNLFSFDLLSANELKAHVAGMYKYSEKAQIDEKNMLTWLLLNWLEISKLKSDNIYNNGNALKAADEIAKMANDRNICVSAIKACLEKYGILYAEVEAIEKAPIDAYCTIHENHPVITVTYRYNDLDKLVFDILHELYHIENHLSGEYKAFISIEGTEYSKDKREKEANDFARQTLIPNHIWNKILKAKCSNLSPNKVIKAIATEAEKFGISPSIAVARYKQDTSWNRTSSYKSPKIC